MKKISFVFWDYSSPKLKNCNNFNMSDGKNGTFTITWRIRNFSMFAAEKGDSIESPIVQVRQFGKSEWSLLLYPKGIKTNKEDYVSCYLKCINVGIYETMRIEFSIVEPSSLKNKIETVNNFIPNGTWGYKNFISVEDILKDDDKYLPKDIFTVICVMKCKNLTNSNDSEYQLINTLLRTSLSGQNSPFFNKCCLETVVPVHNKRFLHPLDRNLLPENEIFTLPLFSAMKETLSFYLTLIKDGGSFIHIEMKTKDEIGEKIFVKCAVSAVNSPKGVNYSAEDEFLFKSKDDVGDLTTFLEFDKLEEDGYFKLNQDFLLLQFELAISIWGQAHHTEKQYWMPPFQLPKQVDPIEIFATPSNSDDKQPVVTLQAGDRSFVVHNHLLKAKSEVFRAMFENDMKEKGTGVVDIQDVDPQTLERVLSFLYSGVLVDLSAAEVGDVYAVAHKYLILSLMEYCSSVLMTSLTASNVCEILILADLYQNDRLLKCAEDFVVNMIDIELLLMSRDWKKLMVNHGSVAANVMYKVLMK